jgi:hypothetical protein
MIVIIVEFVISVSEGHFYYLPWVPKNLARQLTKGEKISSIPFYVTVKKHVNFSF